MHLDIAIGVDVGMGIDIGIGIDGDVRILIYISCASEYTACTDAARLSSNSRVASIEGRLERGMRSQDITTSCRCLVITVESRGLCVCSTSVRGSCIACFSAGPDLRACQRVCCAPACASVCA